MFNRKNKILNTVIFATLALVLLVSFRPTDISSSASNHEENDIILPSDTISTIDPPTETPTETAPNTEPPDDIIQDPDPTPTITPLLPEADEFTETLMLTLSDEVSDELSAEVLLDRDYTTKLEFDSESSIIISADEEIHSLYFIWDLPPGEWNLIDVETQICGLSGYIHEFVILDNPTMEITAQLPNDGAILCNIYAFSDGTPPEWVQVWQPPLPVADMLLVPTHADDEFLVFAGLLPCYAGELDYRIQVAYIVNHWDEAPRTHEMLDGLWSVGIRNYPVIGEFDNFYTESLQEASDFYGYDKIVDFHVELLRRFKPQVVVGHDINGEHRDGAHMLNALALQTAVENAADSTYHTASFEQYGLWDTPKLYLHLYWENFIMMNWDIPLSRFNGATAIDMAVIGYDFYQSQHHNAFSVPQIGPFGHLFGLARSLVGEDVVGGDLFENIIFS
jgi:LmbE family N-acetylglucosaminyl deacetylase